MFLTQRSQRLAEVSFVIPSAVEESLILNLEWRLNNKRCLDFARHDRREFFDKLQRFGKKVRGVLCRLCAKRFGLKELRLLRAGSKIAA